jgi:hypothetical protein
MSSSLPVAVGVDGMLAQAAEQAVIEHLQSLVLLLEQITQ